MPRGEKRAINPARCQRITVCGVRILSASNTPGAT